MVIVIASIGCGQPQSDDDDDDDEEEAALAEKDDEGERVEGGDSSVPEDEYDYEGARRAQGHELAEPAERADEQGAQVVRADGAGGGA